MINLYTMSLDRDNAHITENNEIKFNVPLLKAFGIASARFNSGCLNFIEGKELIINDDEVIIPVNKDVEIDLSDSPTCFLEKNSLLSIFYTGIKDYSLLFPSILRSNQYIDLAKRLGQYYYESELSFQNEAWLSFILMCGAIFEGLLYHKLNYPSNKVFYDLINDSKNSDIISHEEANIMHKARESRNSIHANNFRREYYNRREAVEMKVMLDKLIYIFSY